MKVTAVYDYGKRKLSDERYTILFDSDYGNNFITGISISSEPKVWDIQFQGFTIGIHLGKRIAFSELPELCRDLIMDNWLPFCRKVQSKGVSSG